MGLMTSMVVGAIGGAGEQGAKAFFEQQKALIEKERLSYAQELKDKAEAATRERVKGYSAPVQDAQSAKVIAADYGSGLIQSAVVGADGQVLPRPATAADARQRAMEAGDLESIKTFASVDNLDKDNTRADRKEVTDEKRQAALERRWSSEDEKWRKQFDETVRQHKETIGLRARELGLKESERTQLNKDMDNYTAAVKRVIVMADKATPEDLATLKSDLSAGAARLTSYGIKVPSLDGQGDRATSAQIASSLLKLAEEDYENAPKHRATAGQLLHEAAAGKQAKSGVRPETKTIEGKVYDKVPGGWKLQTK